MAKEKHELKVTERTESGSAASRRARKSGMIPVVVYGHGTEARSFLVAVKDWDIIAKQDVQIVQLQPEKGKEINVLIKDVQYDYLAGITEHIDFQEVKMDEVITATIPIHTTGTPVGISQGGMLEYMMHDVEVSCTPNTLPESIDLNISELELHAVVNIGDLSVPEGVTVLGDPSQTVLHIILPRVETEETEEEGAVAEGEETAEEATAEGGSDSEGGEEAKSE